MSASIVTIDVETQRAITETFSLFSKYTPIERVVVPSRLLCFAAKFYDQEKVHFHAAWEDDDQKSFDKMVEAAWDILDRADVVIGWNNARFDQQWFNAAFGRLRLGPPSPYRVLDLMQVAKKNFKAGEMSLKLQWYSQRWLGDEKADKGSGDLWHIIRYGSKAEKREAQKAMKSYNVKDILLTERLFTEFRPWTGINFALYDSPSDGVEVCPKCSSENVHKRGRFFTTTYVYQRYRCMDCGSWSRGRRSVYTTELRPVA